jgi:hypothetical protein
MDEIWKRSLGFAAENSPVRRRSPVRPPAFCVDGFYPIHNIADDDEEKCSSVCAYFMVEGDFNAGGFRRVPRMKVKNNVKIANP